ncbi:hypothetical protein Dda_6224 [Drechslerella dactyloides]|uniref:Uncharacterized protein n=1 Tax=Drechslerella dactyloides TaxID=74499 RepID=A0AAD6IWP5_DREDA|nr:hypothetical protein Dda_6224 [Drechslerella dactyloides]
MGLRSLKQRFAKRLSISLPANSAGQSSSLSSSASSSSAPSSAAAAAASTGGNVNTSDGAGTGQEAPGAPPAYEDVPVFANPLPTEQIPFLPYELITEIISWAITPAFDEYRQHDSAVHVQTLHNLAAVSPAFLSIVRRVCRETPEIPLQHRTIPCREAHHRSVCTFETAAAWMPISVLAGIFTLDIFERERKFGKLVARIHGFQPNMTALIFLLWNRQAMERMPGVPRHSIYLPYPVPFARHNHHRSINKFNIVLKALANCRHLRFSYVRLSVPALNCSARNLLDAVTAIAPTRYLEVNMQILGWGGGSTASSTGEEEHPLMPGFSAKLPLEILTAGLKRGASRVDISTFRLDDRPANCQSKEIIHTGSLVNFIRARTIPDGVVTTEGGHVFAQLVIGGPLDFQVGGTGGAGGKLAIGKGWRAVGGHMNANKVVVNPFKYTLTAVRDGQREWMGDGEKFAANHFFELALQDGEDVGTAERRRIEEEWAAGP